MGEPEFPEFIALRMRPGWRDRIDEVRRAKGISRADWLRLTVMAEVRRAERQIKREREGVTS